MCQSAGMESYWMKFVTKFVSPEFYFGGNINFNEHTVHPSDFENKLLPSQQTFSYRQQISTKYEMSRGAIMSIVAMKSQCMKTVIHLVDNSDFMLSDHKTHCKSFQQF